MAKFILVNGAYDVYFIPWEQFNDKGWDAMLQSYASSTPDNPKYPAVWLSLYEDSTGETYDHPGIVREALKEIGKRVDKLSMPLVQGREEGSFLGEPGDESGILSQMFEDIDDHAEPRNFTHT